MRQIILASQSPRRKELLSKMGVPFTVVVSNFEEHLDDSRDTAIVAKELGLGKARTVAEQYPEAIVIGSDTIVTLNGKQLGKASDEAHARQMLQDLSGHTHTITSSVAVVCKALGVEQVDAQTATLVFKPLNEHAIEAYLSTGDWRDKAAAYGVQSGAHTLVDHIEGDFSVVYGLPVTPLAHYLRQLGIATLTVHLTCPVPIRRLPD